jgi:hypothetical protein
MRECGELRNQMPKEIGIIATLPPTATISPPQVKLVADNAFELFWS